MSDVDLFIIAAGKGSRMSGTLPKALVRIEDEPCLTMNLRMIGRKFRRVFIATNMFFQEYWEAYFGSLRSSDPDIARLTVNLPIESGLGDGHATLQAIRAAERHSQHELSGDIVIAWGDIIFSSEHLIDEMMSAPARGAGLLPAVQEGNPYVALIVDDSMRCMSADFSRNGERHACGFHDQSVFRFNLPLLRSALGELHNTFWKNGRYISQSGELSLLYSFHYLYNKRIPAYVYETRYPTFGFNTVEEFLSARRFIGKQTPLISRNTSCADAVGRGPLNPGR